MVAVPELVAVPCRRPQVSPSQSGCNCHVSALCSTRAMPPTRLQRAAVRRTIETRRALASQLLHLRVDVGITQTELAAAVGLSQGYIAQIEAGVARPTIETYAALSTALGSDLSIRIYPNTGPAIRDRHQAPIVEALLRLIGPGWRAFPEVPVRAPTRGVVDLVLHHDGPPSVIVASEIESEIRRLEQRLRWHAEKAAAMPSSVVWAAAVATGGPVPTVSRLLILRSTRANRQLARDFEQTLRAAYPASASDCFRALRSDAPWPGAAILWASTDAGPTRILEHPPRGVDLGRSRPGPPGPPRPPGPPWATYQAPVLASPPVTPPASGARRTQ